MGRSQGVTDTVPVVELADIPELAGSEIGYLIDRYRVSAEDAKVGEADKKSIGTEILALMIASGQRKVGHGRLVAVKCNGRSGATLDQHLLIKKGVDPDVIAECWVGGKEYSYVQVTVREEPQ